MTSSDVGSLLLKVVGRWCQSANAWDLSIVTYSTHRYTYRYIGLCCCVISRLEHVSTIVSQAQEFKEKIRDYLGRLDEQACSPRDSHDSLLFVFLDWMGRSGIIEWRIILICWCFCWILDNFSWHNAAKALGMLKCLSFTFERSISRMTPLSCRSCWASTWPSSVVSTFVLEMVLFNKFFNQK